MEKTIVEILGVLAFICEIGIILTKKRKRIFLYNTTANGLNAIQYYIVHAYSGLLSILVTFIRNYVFSYYDSKKKRTPVIWFILIVLFLIAAQYASYNGIITIIPFITTSLYTYSVWQNNMIKFKELHIIIYGLNIIYYLSYGIMVNFITNILFLLLTLVDIKKTRKS